MKSKNASTDPIPVPLLDLSRENNPLRAEIDQAIAAVCDSGWFVLGPDVKQLEADVATHTDAKHAVGCASGSDAILLSLMALDIGPGDEVIVPSFTFFATASAVSRLGATPIFADIDPISFNLDPQSVREAITHRTKAIIPVHLFGQCVDMDAFLEIGKQHNLAIIEDAAQAIGARYKDRGAGSMGDFGCFSFYPTKNLGGFGDAGMVTANCDELADKINLLRGHGMRPRYYHQVVGINSRLDSMQAAVLNIKMRHLPEWTEMRRANAARYQTLLTDAGLTDTIQLPREEEGAYHVWNQYTVRVAGGQRDALKQFLGDGGVGSEVYYPVPLHQQECFKDLQHAPLPVTEQAAEEVLSLPIFPHLSEEEQQRVVARIEQFVATQSQQHAA